MKEFEKAENTEENIAALEIAADENSAVGSCLLWVLDDARDNTNAYGIAKTAITELAAKDAEIKRLQAIERAAREYYFGVASIDELRKALV